MKFKLLKTVFISCALAASLIVSSLAANIGGGTVSATSLNLRSDSNTGSSILANAPNGASVVIREKLSNGWYKVWYNGTEGYMSGAYISFSESMSASLGTGTIKGSSVRMRSEPSLSGTVLASYNTGTAMTVTGVSGAWYKVSYNGITGYVHSDYMTLSASGSAASASSSAAASSQASDSAEALGTGTIKGTYVRMRSEPSLSGAILGHYSTGTTMTVTGVSGAWYKVSYNGITGYVHSSYMTLSASGSADSGSGSTGQALVDTAMKYLGVSYVWGGTSSSGFDCSGLVYYVCNENGYSTNRTAASLYSNGTGVEKSDLAAGDLVFFTSGNYSYIGHVGIYIGNGQFIHASSSSGKVIISELSGTYYTNHYYGARRIA